MTVNYVPSSGLGRRKIIISPPRFLQDQLPSIKTRQVKLPSMASPHAVNLLLIEFPPKVGLLLIRIPRKINLHSIKIHRGLKHRSTGIHRGLRSTEIRVRSTEVLREGLPISAGRRECHRGRPPTNIRKRTNAGSPSAGEETD